MAKLTEDMVVARTKSSDMGAIKKLNCWGSDLEDISLVRRFTNVEVLSLSLNRITSLADFQYCGNLVELYVRRNNIRDLSEICFLQELPRLRRLLLSENPCVEHAGPAYRSTVLRCLPNLEVLDNQQVQPEDVEYALKNGLLLEHPLARRERGSPEPVYYSDESPPMITRANKRNSTTYEFEEESSPYRHSSNSPPADFYYQGEGRTNKSPEPTGTSQTNNNNPNNITPPVTRPSNSTNNCSSQSDSSQSAISNNSSPHVVPTNQVEGSTQQQRRISSPDYGYVRAEPEMQKQMNGRRPSSDYISDGIREQQFYDDQQHNQIRSAHVGQRQPVYVRSTSSKPRTKVSNILSAVLCLIPELDLASCEVLELAVRRRIDECSSD